MLIVIRADASLQIGTGHIMRCLALADTLQERGATVEFICRKFKGNCISLIKERKFRVHVLSPATGQTPVNDPTLPSHADWLGCDWQQDVIDSKVFIESGDRVDLLIVDHYGIDYRWLNDIRPSVDAVMVIDDLADRRFDCDLLLDQTFGRCRDDYSQLVPADCCLLLGSKYALLRAQFADSCSNAMKKRARCTGIQQILVSMGGVDGDNLTSKVIQGLASVSWLRPVGVYVVLGESAPHFAQVKKQARDSVLNIEVLSNVIDMAQLMVESDLAIGAGGTTTWEQCCLGLPLLAVVAAENQKQVIAHLTKAGVVINLGESDSLTPEIIAREVQDILISPRKYHSMSTRAFHVTDGSGTTRVTQHIIGKITGSVALRRAADRDCDLIFSWQSDPEIRIFCRNPAVPSREEHLCWFAASLLDKKRKIFIIEDHGRPVGVIRIDAHGEQKDTFEVSIFIAPPNQGKGFAKHALAALRNRFPGLILMAEIFPENRASKKMFMGMGYKQVDKTWYVSQPHLELVFEGKKSANEKERSHGNC